MSNTLHEIGEKEKPSLYFLGFKMRKLRRDEYIDLKGKIKRSNRRSVWDEPVPMPYCRNCGREMKDKRSPFNDNEDLFCSAKCNDAHFKYMRED